jgi:hypothetical protein
MIKNSDNYWIYHCNSYSEDESYDAASRIWSVLRQPTEEKKCIRVENLFKFEGNFTRKRKDFEVGQNLFKS